jgi:phosphoribosyl 1,2-cyclic phosphodiesterase
VKRVEGRRFEAQVFAKGDRIRLEYKYAVRTEIGYSSIEIIRLDKRESWFLLAQRRHILVVPVKPEDILPIQPSLPGERTRTLVGDAITIGRRSKLYEVLVDYNGRNERFYEWVDGETGVVLKLVSQDRDWSVEYQRIRFSPQPDYYFEEPAGYRRWAPTSGTQERG